MTKEKTVIVIDSSVNADVRERTHDVFVNGELKQITFKYGEKTELPIETGLKFLQDGFRVLDPETETEIEKPAETDETVRLHLKEDECIAKYEELTEDALKLRVARLYGGEDLLKNKVGKKSMIEFIKPKDRAGSDDGDIELEFDEDSAPEEEEEEASEQAEQKNSGIIDRVFGKAPKGDSIGPQTDERVPAVLEKFGAEKLMPKGEEDGETIFDVYNIDDEVVGTGTLEQLLVDESA